MEAKGYFLSRWDGFFSRIMGLSKKLGRNQESFASSEQYLKIIAFNDEVNALLGGVRYIAKSEYATMLPKYKEAIDYFRVLQNSKMLKIYCVENDIVEHDIINILDVYNHIEEKVAEANDKFISTTLAREKNYLDNILKDIDPVIMLDEDQRKVILTDEDYCLVIAGAGAGKTTTVAAKVKYLVEKKGIEPRDILVISFTNKAVGELREKINKNSGIECPIATFHSTGNAILRINDPESLNIFDGSKLYFLLQDYFKQSILKNESLVNNLIMFFASYFEAPYEGADLNEFFNKTAKANYTTMRSELDEFRREVVDRRTKEMKEKLHFKYIIVDEYQDISRQRFDLTTALSEVCDGKIIAVGDDWQSIYAFSGSDISLFTKFQEKMGYAKLLKIVRTYRNAQDVIDIAGNFIQRNAEQIEKQLISPKKIENPVFIYTYDNSYKQMG